MDFRLSAEDEAFRAEVQQWIAEHAPPGGFGVDREEQFDPRFWDLTQQTAKQLAEKGWLTLAWPKEYGGQGRSVIEQAVFQEETMFAGVPGTTMGISGTQWVGPTLILHGSDEQKREHLPPIANAEAWWCTGYSEPGSGSDLAALELRAVKDGDTYVLNGQKTWTSAAHISGWCWLAARTDFEAPKHKGISVFLVDMKTPGVQTRTIINMAGQHSFNEIYFDNARVPAENLVGGENQGWYIVATALDFERSGITYAAYSRKTLALIEGFLQDGRAAGQSWAHDPIARHIAADVAVQVAIQRSFAYRVAWMQSRGLVPNQEASVAKVFGSETQQRAAKAAVRIAGIAGQVSDGVHAPMEGRALTQYLSSISVTIAAGTSEIQRNIIATRGQGLPRS